MEGRYERNIGALTEIEQEILSKKRAAVVGCGGLGCNAAEHLARLGIGHLTLIDGDFFIESNLNRQIYSLEKNLGNIKAFEAEKRILDIRFDISVKAVNAFVTVENAVELLKDHDVIIDALDNVKSRLVIEKAANDAGIPLVHGAVEEWNAQICVVFPGDFTLSMIYSGDSAETPVAEMPAAGNPKKPSVLSFTPAFCAAVQVSQAVKTLLNRENILRRRLLTVDLLENNFTVIEF
jgi:molybdopterin/thiamine biosynthesis adenylyltransferase